MYQSYLQRFYTGTNRLVIAYIPTVLSIQQYAMYIRKYVSLNRELFGSTKH